MPRCGNDIFIAHSGTTRDIELAEALFDQLAELGCQPFLATRCVDLGREWDLAIRDAQLACPVSVILVSASADRAFYLRSEVVTAIELHRDPDEEHGVVPLWIEGKPRARDDIYGLNLLQGIQLDGSDGIGAAAVQLHGLVSGAAGELAAAQPPGPEPTPPVAELITNFRLPRNPHFRGRDEQLDELTRSGAGSQVAITQTVVGMGGVGKSELAAEHVHRQIDAQAVEIVWWVRAEDPATITADLAQLGVALAGAPADEADQAARAAIGALEGQPARRWLLVFDNAPDPDALTGWLPMRGPGQTLITSRQRTGWDQLGAGMLAVPLLSETAAVDFLLQRTGQQDLAAAARLAERLGHLALALSAAAAYIVDSGLRIADYQGLIEEYPGVLVGEEPDPGVRTLGSTFAPSIDRLREANAAAAEMVEIAAYLAPERIPVALFVGGKKGGEATLAKASRAAIDAGRLGLIEPGGDGTFSVHRIVQEVVRRRLGDEAPALVRGLELLQEHHPADALDPASWPACERLASHVLAIADHAPLAHAPVVAALLHQLGNFRWASGAATEARIATERALALRTTALGADHPDTLASLNDLAAALRDQGDLEGARVLGEQVLEARRRTLGPEHPDTLESMGNMAAMLTDRGDLEGARTLAKQVLEASRRTLGPEHPFTLKAMINLAGAVSGQGDLVGARALCEQALEVSQRTLGPEHPDALASMNLLVATLRDQGDLVGALALGERALEASERTLGPEHPQTLAGMTELAATLFVQGDLEGARALLEEALSGAEDTLGADHPQTLAGMNLLVATLRNQGDLDGARARGEQALEASERTLGPEHPQTLAGMTELAATLFVQGDLEGARALLEEALSAGEDALGAGHPQTLAGMNLLVATLRNQGDLDGARALGEQALEASERTLGREHPQTLAGMNDLAATLRDQGDLVGARALAERVLEARQRTLGDQHPDTLVGMNELAVTLSYQGDLNGARVLLEEAAQGAQESLGAFHPLTNQIQENLNDLSS